LETSSNHPDFRSIDRLIHEPVRLAILTILSSVDEVDFNFLITTLGLTKGNLATHVGKLETAGYVQVKKEFRGKLPHTSYELTSHGRREFDKYWDNMNGLAPEQYQANAGEDQTTE
jgi:predicted ArsR family transcriptional regulator